MRAMMRDGVRLLLVIAVLGACDENKRSAPPAPPPSATATGATSASATTTAALPTFDEAQLVTFAPIPDAVDKPVVDDVVKLGRLLYFDPRLSRGGDVSCASCHDPSLAGADGTVLSTGSQKQKAKRNTPTVLNAAGAFAQGWDARTSTIEEYVVPHACEQGIMGMGEEKRLVDAIGAIAPYAAAFQKAFPDEKPSLGAETVGRALGGYVKKLFARSRWDRYLKGDKTALSAPELTGVATFVEAGCTTCHQGKYLGGMQSQKLGIAKPWPPPAGTDPGRFELTKQEADRGMFKIPTLRNVTRTAPYLHDGSIPTLDETVRLMARHQVGRELTDAQVASIVAFLGTLSGDPPKELVPAKGPKPAPSP
jgi:cytochrome c peroxidase